MRSRNDARTFSSVKFGSPFAIAAAPERGERNVWREGILFLPLIDHTKGESGVFHPPAPARGERLDATDRDSRVHHELCAERVEMTDAILALACCFERTIQLATLDFDLAFDLAKFVGDCVAHQVRLNFRERADWFRTLLVRGDWGRNGVEFVAHGGSISKDWGVVNGSERNFFDFLWGRVDQSPSPTSSLITLREREREACRAGRGDARTSRDPCHDA